jgi:hypothetical protein
LTHGIFTISLDFELHWGVFDKRDRLGRKTCYQNTLALVPQLLQRFEDHGVGVTWATVGSLFANNEAEWRSYWPAVLPAYAEEKYSPYAYAEKHGVGEEYVWAHFAPTLVQLITNYEHQELATHTFSHYYCQEAGQTVEAFKADLEKVQELAVKKTGKKICSLVFPRNQFNDAYLKACYEAGITVIRSNPDAWYWSGIGNDDTSLLRKVYRTGDVFFPVGKRSSYPLQAVVRKEGLPISLPASRLLRQFDPKHPPMNALRLKRILSEMSAAAEKNHCYHLWWHPENFGFHPEKCMAELDIILQHFRKLSQTKGMQSWTMKRYADELA